MAWRDLPVEERINICWNNVRKAYNTRDYDKLARYSGMLRDCLKPLNSIDDEDLIDEDSGAERD